MKPFFLILSLVLSANLVSAQDFQKFYVQGNDYAQKGNYKKAIVNLKKAEKLAKLKYEKNRIYKALADNYKAISEYTNAIDYYEKLLKLYDEENRKKVLLNLSDLWIITGQYKKVTDSLKNMQNCPDETVRLTNLSAAYFKTRKTQDAIKLLDSVLQNQNSPNYKIALQNKGYIYWRIHKSKEAEELLEKAINLYDNDDGGKYICMGNLAMVKSEKEKHIEALKLINQAVEWQFQHLGKRNQDYIISLRKKAEILQKAGKTADAAASFKEFFYAEKEYITRNFMYMTEQERLNFWHTVKFQIDKCYQIGNQDAEFLFDVALFQKNVLTLANVNFYQIASNHEKADKLLELRAKAVTAELSVRNMLEAQAEELEKELVGSFSALKDFKTTLNISHVEINKTLKAHEAAVEFVYYRKDDTMRYAAVVLQKDKGIKFVDLFVKNEIHEYNLETGGTIEKCIRLANAKRLYNSNYIYNDKRLANFIWDKITDNMPQNTTIYFVPDGIFHRIAVEYLCPENKHFNFYRLSSMRVLTEKHSKQNYDNVLLIGDVNYTDTSKAVRHSDTLPDRTGSKIKGSCQWDHLDKSLKEMYNAKNNLKISFKDMLLKNQATEETVKNVLPNYNTVIISTHGYSDSKNENAENATDKITENKSMFMCGIVLSGAQILSKGDSALVHFEDGLLTAAELSRLDLSNVDLIVLSACETNLGTLTGNGIFNIPRGLKKAGVNSVIATLWEVNDEKTCLFMSEFYRQLRLDKTKYEALKASQNYLRKVYHGKYDEPQYWAPFVLIDGLN
ncbi:MAG: CHAT domain-containing protein [Bacteroidales bacterium]|nr:CHAT domain-containing protein [Bacteroidales bacterium]